MEIKLRIVSGELKGETFDLDGPGPFVLGRNSECGVQITRDSRISRQHCVIEKGAGGFELRDLESRNGTFLNSRLVGGGPEGPKGSQARPISNRDVIRIGRTEVRVEIAKEAGAADGRVSGDPPTATLNGPASEGRDEFWRGSSVDSPPAVFPEIPGYDLRERIGIGGYGAVYLATRPRDGLEVGIKVMLPKVVVDERARRRFLKEISFMGRLRHEHLVALHESGEVEGGFYFVMDYCSGGSLKSLYASRGRPFEIREAVTLVSGALLGLEHAHEKGIVHRDVKPSNVLVHLDGERRVPKLGDLGLAKEFEQAGFSDLTRSGTFAGTLAYMPREQLVNFRYVRPASDIWSMAATLYFLLTGLPPRSAPGPVAPLEAVLSGTIVPIEERRPEVPSRLAAVIDRALALDVEARPPSAKQLRDELEDAL